MVYMIEKTDPSNTAGGATDGDAELEARANAGDRDAIRELRHRKLAGFARDRIVGPLTPDQNGRIQGDPMYIEGGTK
jgi:hypothetical protein